MLRLGSLDLDRSDPLLAAAFGDNTLPQTIADVRAAGLDVAEVRIDLFEDCSVRHVRRELKKFRGLPVIATIRATDESGGWRSSEADRLALFRAILPTVDAVDIELNSTGIRDKVVKAVHKAGKLAIVSSHDFEATPSLSALKAIVRRASQGGADLVKIATMARDDADVRTLARLLVESEKDRLIVIAMGAVGTKSRVFFPALGSRMTFASLNHPTAPGQMDLLETVEELRAYYPEFNQRKINELELMEAV